MTDALESLNGLIVPLVEDALLLPNVAVAELVGYRLSQPATQGPAWFLGWAGWRDQRVPMIDPDVLLGLAVAEDAVLTPQALIINAVGERKGLKFIGMRVRGIPRSKKVLRGEIDMVGEASAFITCPVSLADEPGRLLIPDLLAIEQALADAGLLAVDASA